MLLWASDTLFQIIGFVPVSFEAKVIIYCTNIFFIFGSATISLSLVRKGSTIFFYTFGKFKHKETRLIQICLIVFVLSGLGYAFYIQATLQSVGTFESLLSFFKEWNYQSSHGALADFGGWRGRLYVLSSFGISFNVFAYQFCQKRKKTILLLTLVEVFFLLSPRRALLIQSLTQAVFLYYLVNPEARRQIMRLVLLAVAVGLFFVFTQMALSKSLGESLLAGIKDIFLYVAGNMPALSLVLNGVDQTWGELTFNVPCRMLAIFSEFFPHPDLSIDFVSIPIAFNTVPYQYYLVRDFGLISSVIITWLMGFFFTWYYYNKRTSYNFFHFYLISGILNSIFFSFREFIVITYNFHFFVFFALLTDIFLALKVKFPRYCGIQQKALMMGQEVCCDSEAKKLHS